VYAKSVGYDTSIWYGVTCDIEPESRNSAYCAASGWENTGSRDADSGLKRV
jgi:hypothetical protein